jgi:hypothetical protein
MNIPPNTPHYIINPFSEDVEMFSAGTLTSAGGKTITVE